VRAQREGIWKRHAVGLTAPAPTPMLHAASMSLSPLPAATAEPEPKLEHLRRLFTEMGSALVCFSGGVDSAFVLAVAHQVLGDRAVAMTAVSPSLAPAERALAIEVAAQIGARHELVESQEIEDESYLANNSDRCFHCKSELYRLTTVKRPLWGLAHVVNGTNKDDLGDYRPGLEAARNAGVRSPLVEADFHKDDIRRVASKIGLSVWDKPAAACLSSRIPYGTRVTRERLAQIAALEADLHALGLRQVRVRWHAVSSGQAVPEAAMARVEVAEAELPRAFELRAEMTRAGKTQGFAYVTLDLQGYRMGSHNEVLGSKRLPVLG
jgi:pyridinium-3,5-biscarboxylic acid mononucleotide sulfurtransferase